MILAHNYGIDEGLTILVPLVLFALILRAGRKRQAAEEARATTDEPETPPTTEQP